MAGVGPAQPRRPAVGAARPLEPGDGGGGEGVGVHVRDGLVQAAQHLGRAGAAVVGDAAQQAAELAHRGRRRGVVPDDVADDEDRRAVALQEGVVPVAADAGGLGRRARSGRRLRRPPAPADR